MGQAFSAFESPKADPSGIFNVNSFAAKFSKDGSYTNEEPWLADWRAPRSQVPVPLAPPKPNADGAFADNKERDTFEAWFNWEWRVYLKEIVLVREELQVCVVREGPNAPKMCRELTERYMDLYNRDKKEYRRTLLQSTKEPLVKNVLKN